MRAAFGRDAFMAAVLLLACVLIDTRTGTRYVLVSAEESSDAVARAMCLTCPADSLSGSQRLACLSKISEAANHSILCSLANAPTDKGFVCTNCSASSLMQGGDALKDECISRTRQWVQDSIRCPPLLPLTPSGQCRSQHGDELLLPHDGHVSKVLYVYLNGTHCKDGIDANFNILSSYVSAKGNGNDIIQHKLGDTNPLPDLETFTQIWFVDFSVNEDSYSDAYNKIGSWFKMGGKHRGVIADGRFGPAAFSDSSCYPAAESLPPYNHNDIFKNYFDVLQSKRDGGIVLTTDGSEFHSGINDLCAELGINLFKSYNYEDKTLVFTTDADWAKTDPENRENVNYEDVPNALKVNRVIKTAFGFIWVPLSGLRKVVKINTMVTGQCNRFTGSRTDADITKCEKKFLSEGCVWESNECKDKPIVGIYWATPAGKGHSPSRGVVDQDGNLWMGMRNDHGANGVLVKMGLKENNQCEDRNGDGIIDTSSGVSGVGLFEDIRAWSSGFTGSCGGIHPKCSTAMDECILMFLEVPTRGVRGVGIDGNKDVWIAGTTNTIITQINGLTGEIKKSFTASACGSNIGYALTVHPSTGWVFSTRWSGNNIWRYKPEIDKEECFTCPGAKFYSISTDNGLANSGKDERIWGGSYGTGQMVRYKHDNPRDCQLFSSYSQQRGMGVTSDGEGKASMWGTSTTNPAQLIRLDADTGQKAAGFNKNVKYNGQTCNGGMTAAPDSAGNIWIVCHSSNDMFRYNNEKKDFDYRVVLPGGNPYTYSDLTGNTVVKSGKQVGVWTYIHDSQRQGTVWKHVDWNTEAGAEIPAGTAIDIKARSAESYGQFFSGTLPWTTLQKNTWCGLKPGRYLEVHIAMTKKQGENDISPTLTDFRLSFSPSSDGVWDIVDHLNPLSTFSHANAVINPPFPHDSSTTSHGIVYNKKLFGGVRSRGISPTGAISDVAPFLFTFAFRNSRVESDYTAISSHLPGSTDISANITFPECNLKVLVNSIFSIHGTMRAKASAPYRIEWYSSMQGFLFEKRNIVLSNGAYSEERVLNLTVVGEHIVTFTAYNNAGSKAAAHVRIHVAYKDDGSPCTKNSHCAGHQCVPCGDECQARGQTGSCCEQDSCGVLGQCTNGTCDCDPRSNTLGGNGGCDTCETRNFAFPDISICGECTNEETCNGHGTCVPTVDRCQCTGNFASAPTPEPSILCSSCLTFLDNTYAGLDNTCEKEVIKSCGNFDYPFCNICRQEPSTFPFSKCFVAVQDYMFSNCTKKESASYCNRCRSGSFNYPHCEKCSPTKTCVAAPPPPPEHGQVVCTNPEGNVITENFVVSTICTYSCREGLTLVGTHLARRCLCSGEWDMADVSSMFLSWDNTSVKCWVDEISLRDTSWSANAEPSSVSVVVQRRSWLNGNVPISLIKANSNDQFTIDAPSRIFTSSASSRLVKPRQCKLICNDDEKPCGDMCKKKGDDCYQTHRCGGSACHKNQTLLPQGFASTYYPSNLNEFPVLNAPDGCKFQEHSITLNIIDDDLWEEDEPYNLRLILDETAKDIARITVGEGTLTIAENDEPVFRYTQSRIRVQEDIGKVIITVTRMVSKNKLVKLVAYTDDDKAWKNSSNCSHVTCAAHAELDYIPKAKAPLMEFPDQVEKQTFTIQIIDDEDYEPDETIFLAMEDYEPWEVDANGNGTQIIIIANDICNLEFENRRVFCIANDLRRFPNDTWHDSSQNIIDSLNIIRSVSFNGQTIGRLSTVNGTFQVGANDPLRMKKPLNYDAIVESFHAFADINICNIAQIQDSGSELCRVIRENEEREMMKKTGVESAYNLPTVKAGGWFQVLLNGVSSPPPTKQETVPSEGNDAATIATFRLGTLFIPENMGYCDNPTGAFEEGCRYKDWSPGHLFTEFVKSDLSPYYGMKFPGNPIVPVQQSCTCIRDNEMSFRFEDGKCGDDNHLFQLHDGKNGSALLQLVANKNLGTLTHPRNHLDYETKKFYMLRIALTIHSVYVLTVIVQPSLGGFFTLVHNDDWTAPLQAKSTSANDVKEALIGLGSVDGDVYVTKIDTESGNGFEYKLIFSKVLLNRRLLMDTTYLTFNGKYSERYAVNEVQRITTSGSGELGGQYSLSYGGVNSYSLSASSASAELMKIAIEETIVALGKVHVQRENNPTSNGFIYSVTFDSALGDIDLLGADNSFMTEVINFTTTRSPGDAKVVVEEVFKGRSAVKLDDASNVKQTCTKRYCNFVHVQSTKNLFKGRVASLELPVLVEDVNEPPTGIMFNPPPNAVVQSGDDSSNDDGLSSVGNAQCIKSEAAIWHDDANSPNKNAYGACDPTLLCENKVANGLDCIHPFKDGEGVACCSLVQLNVVAGMLCQVVATLDATDPDCNSINTMSGCGQDVLNFALVSGAGDDDNNKFKVQPDGGKFLLRTSEDMRAVLDQRYKQLYSIRVRVYDRGNLNLTQVMPIQVVTAPHSVRNGHDFRNMGKAISVIFIGITSSVTFMTLHLRKGRKRRKVGGILRYPWFLKLVQFAAFEYVIHCCIIAMVYVVKPVSYFSFVSGFLWQSQPSYDQWAHAMQNGCEFYCPGAGVVRADNMSRDGVWQVYAARGIASWDIVPYTLAAFCSISGIILIYLSFTGWLVFHTSKFKIKKVYAKFFAGLSPLLVVLYQWQDYMNVLLVYIGGSFFLTMVGARTWWYDTSAFGILSFALGWVIPCLFIISAATQLSRIVSNEWAAKNERMYGIKDKLKRKVQSAHYTNPMFNHEKGELTIYKPAASRRELRPKTSDLSQLAGRGRLKRTAFSFKATAVDKRRINGALGQRLKKKSSHKPASKQKTSVDMEQIELVVQNPKSPLLDDVDGIGWDADEHAREPKTGTRDNNTTSPYALPKNWYSQLDSQSGRLYYINRSTNETSWNLPDIAVDEEDSDSSYSSDSDSSTSSSSDREDDEDLPDDWSFAIDSTYKTKYYYNNRTGNTVWKKEDIFKAGKGQEGKRNQRNNVLLNKQKANKHRKSIVKGGRRKSIVELGVEKLIPPTSSKPGKDTRRKSVFDVGSFASPFQNETIEGRAVSLFFPASWGPAVIGRKMEFKTHLSFESRMRLGLLVWPYRWSCCMFWLVTAIGHCARGVIVGGIPRNSGHGIQLWALIVVDFVSLLLTWFFKPFEYALGNHIFIVLRFWTIFESLCQLTFVCFGGRNDVLAEHMAVLISCLQFIALFVLAVLQLYVLNLTPKRGIDGAMNKFRAWNWGRPQPQEHDKEISLGSQIDESDRKRLIMACIPKVPDRQKLVQLKMEQYDQKLADLQRKREEERKRQQEWEEAERARLQREKWEKEERKRLEREAQEQFEREQEERRRKEEEEALRIKKLREEERYQAEVEAERLRQERLKREVEEEERRKHLEKLEKLRREQEAKEIAERQRKEKERRKRMHERLLNAERQLKLEQEEAARVQREIREFENMKKETSVEIRRQKKMKTFEDTKEKLTDGLVLLRSLDELEFGIVDWEKVNSLCKNKFQCIENCNVVISAAKEMGFSLSNIGGLDIVNENRKLVSSLVWQMIRRMLGSMFEGGENMGYGATVELIEWANQMVRARHEKLLDDGKEHYLLQIDGYNDPKIANGHFLLELLDAVQPGCVFWHTVRVAHTEDGSINAKGLIANAQQVVKVMRKIGCILVLFDIVDILHVDEMWIVSLIGSVLHRHRQGGNITAASQALEEKENLRRAVLRVQRCWRKRKGGFAKYIRSRAESVQAEQSEDGEEWYYMDSSCEAQGPFSSAKMMSFKKDGLIDMDLMVAEAGGKWIEAQKAWWWNESAPSSHNPFVKPGSSRSRGRSKAKATYSKGGGKRGSIVSGRRTSMIHGGSQSHIELTVHKPIHEDCSVLSKVGLFDKKGMREEDQSASVDRSGEIWERGFDESGVEYYFCDHTGETSWDWPDGKPLMKWDKGDETLHWDYDTNEWY